MHDPLADADEAVHEYGLTLSPDALDGVYDVVIGAVAHESYKALDPAGLTAAGGFVVDLKRLWPHVQNSSAMTYWTL